VFVLLCYLNRNSSNKSAQVHKDMMKDIVAQVIARRLLNAAFLKFFKDRYLQLIENGQVQALVKLPRKGK